MCNGYGPAMHIFIKIAKIPFRRFRKNGHVSFVYVDGTYLQGKIRTMSGEYHLQY